MNLRRTGCEGVCVEWSHMPQDGDQWRAIVNTVMRLRFLFKGREFLD